MTPTPAAESGALHRSVVTAGALILLLHLVYGVAMTVPRSGAVPYFGAASLVLAALLAITLATTFNLPSTLPKTLDPWPASVTIAAAVGVTECYFALPGKTAILATLLTAAAQALLLVRKWHGLSLALSALTGAALALYTAIARPDTAGDMMPVIRWALDQMLHGRDPYVEDHSSITDSQLYYLPVQFLVFLPFRYLNLDTRLGNAVAVIVTFAVAAGLLKGRRRNVTLALLVAIAISKPSIELAANGHLWPMWALVTALAALAHTQRWRMAAAILGVLLAYNQTMLCLAALAFVYRLSTRPGLRTMVIETLCVALAYAIFIVPYVIISPNYLAMMYIILPREAGILNNASLDNDIMQMSLTNLLHHAGLLNLRAPLQAAAVLLGMAALATPCVTRRCRPFSTERFLWWSGVIFLVAIALNVQVWKYYYIAGLILIAFGTRLAPAGDTADAA